MTEVNIIIDEMTELECSLSALVCWLQDLRKGEGVHKDVEKDAYINSSIGIILISYSVHFGDRTFLDSADFTIEVLTLQYIQDLSVTCIECKEMKNTRQCVALLEWCLLAYNFQI